MFEGSASKQEQVQEVIVVFWAPVFVQQMPAAHCVRLLTNDLGVQHSAVDKARGFNRIQMHFIFPLRRVYFNCVLKYTVP